VTAIAFDRDARAVVIAVDGSAPVRFPVAPSSAAATEDAASPRDGALAGWTVAGVSAPEDDRRLTVALERTGKFRGSPPRHGVLDISFVPAARGARLRGDGGESRMGSRLPPLSEPRPLLDPGALTRALRDDDRPALLRGRWMSAPVVEWLRTDPARAAERYAALAALPAEAPPCVGPLFAGDDTEAETAAVPEIDGRRARAIARMERELAHAGAAPRAREAATILQSLGDVPAPRRIDLSDGPFDVAPRAGERAAQAAERLHAEAGSMERALESLPARIVATRAAPAPALPTKPAAPVRRGAPRVARPFREYRSSGGLDIWVGRGAASNDALTFHESSPDDVWMHARDVAGAHVVLRWTRDDPPPARDLAEAAAIAAWHSKARGNTVTPVDWTRRKHVRKPRGGVPGLVLVDHVKTVNARPSAALERALRRSE
jgi:hypothetical protein